MMNRRTILTFALLSILLLLVACQPAASVEQENK